MPSFVLNISTLSAVEPKGIQNLGNTCFMSSIFQTLLSIDGFTQYVDSLACIMNSRGCNKTSGGDFYMF